MFNASRAFQLSMSTVVSVACARCRARITSSTVSSGTGPLRAALKTSRRRRSRASGLVPRRKPLNNRKYTTDPERRALRVGNGAPLLVAEVVDDWEQRRDGVEQRRRVDANLRFPTRRRSGLSSITWRRGGLTSRSDRVDARRATTPGSIIGCGRDHGIARRPMWQSTRALDRRRRARSRETRPSNEPTCASGVHCGWESATGFSSPARDRAPGARRSSARPGAPSLWAR